MKKFLILCLLIFVVSLKLYAHDSTSVSQPIRHHQFEIRYGAGAFFYAWSEQIDVSYGWRFNRRYFLGMGTGIHWNEMTNNAEPSKNCGVVNSIPVYVDFKRYFPIGKRKIHLFYLGVDAGPSFFLSTPFKRENEDFLLVCCRWHEIWF